MKKLSIALTVALTLAACGGAAGTATRTPTPAPSSSAPMSAPPATASPTPAASGAASATPIPLPAAAQVAAAGNGVVWMLVADTHLFVSNDRGATWTERTVAPASARYGIAFVDATNGWALEVGSPATQCQAQDVTLWRTADGARTWNALMAVRSPGTAAAVGMGEAQCKENLAFVDAQHGFVSAYDPNGAPTIYRTSDGGKTWAGAKLPDPPGFTSKGGGFTLRAGAVADFGTVLYVDAVGNTGTKETTYVFRSTDEGASWTFSGTAPDLEPGAQIVFVTPTRWLAPLAPAPWAETTDAGATWHPFQTDYQQAAPVTPQIVFGDATTGYATVRGALQRTTDGGAHWTSLRTPGT